MVGSASGPGSTFKAFLGSTRVRVPLSNKIRVRVGSAQHIYGSLRVSGTNLWTREDLYSQLPPSLHLWHIACFIELSFGQEMKLNDIDM